VVKHFASLQSLHWRLTNPVKETSLLLVTNSCRSFTLSSTETTTKSD
jgi:hypothetical protein